MLYDEYKIPWQFIEEIIRRVKFYEIYEKRVLSPAANRIPLYILNDSNL